MKTALASRNIDVGVTLTCRGDRVKAPWVYVILTLSLLSLIVSCGNQDRIDATPNNSFPIIVQGMPPSVKAFEQRARDAVKQLQPDAYLVEAGAIVPASRLDGTFALAGSVSFDYRSRVDTQSNYHVDFDSGGYPSVFKFSDSNAGDAPIEASQWKLDSTDAWQIALTNGANALLERYRRETKDLRCSLTLKNWKLSNKERIVWHVNCTDVPTRKVFDYWIDPQTGEIIESKTR